LSTAFAPRPSWQFLIKSSSNHTVLFTDTLGLKNRTTFMYYS
jgi:hypothetical protein